MTALAPRKLAPVVPINPLYLTTYTMTHKDALGANTVSDPITYLDERDPDAPVYIYRSGKRVHVNVPLCEGCDARVIGVCWACNHPVAPFSRSFAWEARA